MTAEDPDGITEGVVGLVVTELPPPDPATDDDPDPATDDDPDPDGDGDDEVPGSTDPA